MSNDARQQELGLKNTGQLDNVEEYRFEPIKGYPMLNWHGKRPFISTQYYPAQQKETYGEAIEGWRNKIYWGDNLQVMSHLLKDFRGQIKLMYIDPPFDSKADYKMKIRIKGKQVTNDRTVLEEKQYTDIWTNDEYLQFMYERLIIMRELLSEEGVIALHCDWRKSHHLRCILDEIYGANNFRGEALVRAGTKNVQSQFDTVSALTVGHNSVFLYSKSSSLRLPKLASTLEEIEPGKWDTFWRGTDRRTMRYELFGQIPDSGQWRWEQNRASRAAENYDEYLKRFSEKMSLDEYYLFMLNEEDIDLDFVRLNGDNVVQYYVPPRGYKILSNVWFDLSYRGNQTSYPTEKHEDIVVRLVEWLTEPHDIVFDCFMGSGTTQAVAMKLGRRFIGADINLGAVQTTTKRLIAVAAGLQNSQHKLMRSDDEAIAVFYRGFEVCNVNYYDIFRNPVEAKDILLQALEINRLQAGHLFDGEKDGRMIKVMPINRIATRKDLNELITNVDYRAFERRFDEHPSQPVERITLVCMGHEPGLAAYLEQEIGQGKYKLDIEVVDILRDKQDLQFKRDSEARIVIQDNYLVIEQFYPMNLLSKLSLQYENVEDWRELVESVMIDWNYDGAVLQPALVDIPDNNELVEGRYLIPEDAGTIRIKITDLLSESLEHEVQYG